MASLIEFLEAVGLENVTVQPLHQCMDSISMNKNGEAKVTFFTREISPTDVIGKISRTAFIVWMPAEKFDAALKKTKGK